MANRSAEEEEKKSRWEDCSPDCGDCGAPSLDCDLPGCDCGFMMLSPLTVGLLALGRLFRLSPGKPTRPPRTRPTVPGRAGMMAIRGYQRWLSPRLRAKCRHIPHCSAYGMESVRRYGLLAGSQLTADRISRCKAPTPHGTVDPVP
jgi:putative membrane protein insertion efficiency factor